MIDFNHLLNISLISNRHLLENQRSESISVSISIRSLEDHRHMILILIVEINLFDNDDDGDVITWKKKNISQDRFV